MKDYYCWRCDQILPFLDEEEWAQIEPLIMASLQQIKDYRSKHFVTIEEAYQQIGVLASVKFEEITGISHFPVDAMYHHRLSHCGVECCQCGHLLRTPKSSYCAYCGEEK